MRKPLKRFVDRATASRPDPFRSARWKLTVLYCALLAAVVGVLSGALYEFHSHDVDRLQRKGKRPFIVEGTQPSAIVPGAAEREFDAAVGERTDAAEYLERLGQNILLADLITLLVGGALAALLAGRTLRPIRETVESEKQFYANAAHDLRTPLAVMRSEAEVALRAPQLTPADARRIVASSLEEIDRMSVMVEQMLDLARGGHKRPAQLAPVDLAALAQATVEKRMSRAAQGGVRLSVTADPAARIRGDTLSLQRALDNLLENALAYTPSGGSVDVAVEKAHGHVLLRVDDTGIGIPESDLPRITEPFFRGDRARGVHPGGAGLGLTIVKDTVEAHGGSLRAGRRTNGGTTIALRFPAA